MNDVPTGFQGTAYLAAEGFEKELETELQGIDHRLGLLLLKEGPAIDAAWAQNIWHDPVMIPIESIGDGARKLREIQRNWVLWPHQHHRRARLIQEKLPHVSAKPLRFPDPAPSAPLGSWTLWDENTILAAPHCRSAFPHGEIQFVENKTEPPNRAYLKLWEALTILGHYPGPGDTCLDLGASPGGWSWALATLGATVTAIDKAPLRPDIAALPNVTQCLDSAFALDPLRSDAVDWLFSDVICYPARLLGLVQRWIASGKVRHMICTIKFQGETDHQLIDEFKKIPGAMLRHLYHNKHELTFFWSSQSS